MDVKVVFLAHRVEFLELLREEVEGYTTIILEEPEDRLLKRFLDGYLSLEDYVKLSNTSFPVYTMHQARLLKDLHSKGVEIIQVEPYLEIIEEIYQSIEIGRFEEYSIDLRVKKVLEVEKDVVGALINYQEELIRGNFDRIVSRIIEFAKKDAERFKLRDRMRAEAISDLKIDGEIVVEAGYLHILLPRYLEEKGIRTSTVNLVEKASILNNLKLMENPGDILTKAYMMEIGLGEDERLKAAQSLLYLLLISRGEKTPTHEILFPHLVEEIEIINKINNLDYEECKEEFYRIYRKRAKLNYLKCNLY